MKERHGLAASHFTAHRIVVLLIDDQKIIGEAVRRLLAEESDIEFHFCHDPNQALVEAERLEPTLILQDLVMPGVDGLDQVRMFRQHPLTQAVPLIVLSSKEEPRTKAEAFACGANDYLVKLPDRIELIARIRYHSSAYIAQLQRDEAYRALAAELAEAAEYVRSLLPVPRRAGSIRSNWEFVPSTALGGDAFGYFDIDPDHFAFFLLDVCGHGIGAALLSVSAMNALTSQSLPEADFRDPGSVLAELNAAFAMEKHNQLYFTIAYGVWQRSSRLLRYASAGHPPTIVVPAQGDSLALRQRSMPIGVLPDLAFPIEERILPEGSRIYLFSDGIYEITRAEGGMVTFDEFQQTLDETVSAGGSPREILAAMRAVQGKHDFEDDVSILELVMD
jgi:sigma-B regulation protein RsbU (phosphoserine phosphatase)